MNVPSGLGEGEGGKTKKGSDFKLIRPTWRRRHEKTGKGGGREKKNKCYPEGKSSECEINPSGMTIGGKKLLFARGRGRGEAERRIC